MVLGTLAGPLADKYGRKLSCIAFGVIYSLSCVTKVRASRPRDAAPRVSLRACRSIPQIIGCS